MDGVIWTVLLGSLESKRLLSTSEAESPVFLTGSHVCVFQTGD